MSDGTQSAPPDAPPRLRGRMFGLTWLSYSSLYFARKNFSVVKSNMEKVGFGTKSDFAAIDTLYSVGYSLGQFGWGFTADTVSPRFLLGCGMLASAALSFIAGMGDVIGIILLAYGLNGLAQSTGWPSNGRIMASWFGTHERGTVMGFWGTCYQFGPLAAGWFATFLLVRFGWRGAFIGPGIWVAVVGIAIILLVRERPSKMGYRDPDIEGPPLDDAERAAARKQAWKGMLANPQAWCLGANYFCLKFIRYSLWAWLPYYFSKQLHYSDGDAGYMSLSFDLGGAVGVVAAGLLADKLFGRRRLGVATVGMFLLSASLLLYSQVGASSMWANFLSMTLVGAVLFAPDSLVSGAASQDLGGPHGAAAACGFVNGVGSIGQICQSFATVWVSEAYGWDAVIYMFVALAFVGGLVLIPVRKLQPA